ncbi:MAG TPA: DUF2298 domain-containing protein [Thermomicrobiales bacterium]|jgi:YYY domain-containing protein|nr:DUF2298 domain-containing protein [Thermomicrobiales bacterium]
MDTLNDAIRWYLVLMAVSWAVGPLVALLCRGLADRGAGIARPIGLLMLILPTWWLSSIGLIPFTTIGLWMSLGAIAIVAWAIGWRAGVIDRRWLAAMVVAELTAIAAFALYVWFRGHQPAIIETEKPMDSLFLASSIRTETMPPPDPWFAGEPINYYYLGYLLNGAVARMADVSIGVAFNLALAGTFAASVAAASSVAFNVVRRVASGGRAVAGGVLGVILVVWAGNFASFRLFAEDPSGQREASWWGGLGWDSSRVIIDADNGVDPITEFPAFSFVLGDLHPHLMVIPFVLMALGLAANLLFGLVPPSRVRRAGTTVEADVSRTDRVGPAVFGRIAASGALIGSLYALNSWDLPTYGLVAAIAVLVAIRHAQVRDRLLALGALAVAAVVAWLPFLVSFSPPVAAGDDDLPAALRDIPVLSTLLALVAPVAEYRTDMGEFSSVFGVPTVIAVVFLAWSLTRPGANRTSGLRPPELLAIVTALVILALLAQTPVLLVAGLIVMAALEVARREGAPSPRAVAAGLMALSYVLIVAVELFYLRDVFGNRMNTVFKIHYQAWILLGIASAIALIVLWSDCCRLAPSLRLTARFVAAAVTICIIGIVSVYPVVAGQRYSVAYEDAGWQTLDGQAIYRERLPDEMAAVDWLSANTEPGDRVLEAAGCSYQILEQIPANLVSVATGLPTLIGWTGHESQWRNGVEPEYGEITPRALDVAALYADPSSIMGSETGFDFVFVGTAERSGANDRGDCDFTGPYEIDENAFAAAGWQVAFQQGDVIVYARPGA